MSVEFATWLARLFYGYAVVGIVLLPWWHLGGLRRLDTAAGAGPWGFRVLISFGLVALWPWMLSRLRGANGHPRAERNAHRDAAQPETPS